MLFRLSRTVYGLLFAGLVGLFAFQRPPADDSVARRIVRSLLHFYAETLPEKAYLHLDRPYYAPGQTIWLKAYVVEADSHQPDTLSRVLYVELFSPHQKLVVRRTLHLTNGMAPADITLPDTLSSGTYQLRAYTNWMRNAGPDFLFTRPLTLVSNTTSSTQTVSTRPDVQFFPESGTLLAGIAGTIGFKAVGADGRGMDLQGQIVDEQNLAVGRFTSTYRGMGSFAFMPVAGHQYQAVIQTSQGTSARYPLPMASATGYNMHLSENPEEFVVTLNRRAAPNEAPDQAVILLAHVREQVPYAAQIQLTGTAPVVARLPKAKFQAGLAHLTLFDAQGTALCERLAFIPPREQARLTLSLDKSSYGPREAVHATLRATNESGQPVTGEFSVAVSLADASPAAASWVGTISSHLLLTSDLAGPVETPGYYLQQPQTPAVQQALNNLLMTQGWRRFVWKQLMTGPTPHPAYVLETGLTVAGQLLNQAGQPLAQQPVSYLQTSPSREGQVTTDANGRFLFRGLDGADTALVMLRAQLPKAERGGYLQLQPYPSFATIWPADLVASGSMLQYAKQLPNTIPVWATSGTVSLGNVIIKGQPVLSGKSTDGVTRTYNSPAAVYLPVGHLAATAGSQTVVQYLRGRVGGVVVNGESVNIRGAMTLHSDDVNGPALIPPLYMLDGSIISGAQFAAVPLAEIETIDILKQSAANMFGSKAYGGVIILHSRNRGIGTPKQDLRPSGNTPVVSTSLPGFYQAREFYMPRYSSTNSTLPDPRQVTLFWAPTVRTQADGTAQFTFYTSDAKGSFAISAEGLSATHLPLHGAASLRIQEKN